MKCPNCSAECSNQTASCEFCGYAFIDTASTASVVDRNPPTMPSGNPYAASNSTAQGPGVAYSAGKVSNNLVWAILATLCCCMPAGIVAIVYAAQVDGKLATGDYQGAQNASKNAKMWSWISFGGAAIIFVMYFILIMIGAISDSGNF